MTRALAIYSSIFDPSSHEDLCDFASEPLAKFIDSQPSAASLRLHLQGFEMTSPTLTYESVWIHLLTMTRFYAKSAPVRKIV